MVKKETHGATECGLFVEDAMSNMLYMKFTVDGISIQRIGPSFGTLPFYLRFLYRNEFKHLWKHKSSHNHFEGTTNSTKINSSNIIDFRIHRSFLGSKWIQIQTNQRSYRFRLKTVDYKERIRVIRWLLLAHEAKSHNPTQSNPNDRLIRDAISELVATRSSNNIMYDITINIIANIISFSIGLALALAISFP